MRWIRWSYVAPRLGLLCILAGAIQFSVPPAVRWSLTTSGRAALGTHVEVGDVECSLLQPRIVVRDVRVADPAKPQANLFSADRIALEIEPRSLTKKRMVIRRGEITGLEFGTPRNASDDRNEVAGLEAAAVLAKIAGSAAGHGKAWFAAYWSNLQTGLQRDLRRDFQSVALADELAQHWPEVYSQYDARVRDLVKQGEQIEATIREALVNPLRNLAELKRATDEIDRVNQEIGKLADDLNSLAPQLAEQRQAVWDAWETDLKTLQESIALDEARGPSLTEYLLAEEAAGRVGLIVSWINRIRSLVPASHGASQPQRRRGVDVLFAGLRRHPDYLVRSIEIHGKGRHLGETFELSGTILGLSSQPALQDRPTIVKIAGRGALAVDVLASIDRRGDVPIDRLVIRCPAVQRPAIELGHSDSFALTLAGGRDEIEAKLKLTDNQLNGTLSWRMQDGGLRVAAHHTAAAERLADAMNAGLAEIGPIGATLHLGGSLAEPTIRMESELGSDVLVAMQSAATQEVARQRQELETALKQYVQDKLVEVDRVVDNHRRWLEQNLNEQRSTLIRLVADTSGYGHLPAVRMSSSERSEPHGSKPATYQR